jgi:SHS2 domain-containing protein
MTSRLPGVTFLEHTADVGIDVEAPSAELLFHRAATGMLALLRGDEEGPGAGALDLVDPSRVEIRPLEVTARDRPGLLRAWLRELLLLHETGDADYVGGAFLELTERRLEARIRTAPSGGAVREIKGVTYHELWVQDTDGGWKARVIFDV